MVHIYTLIIYNASSACGRVRDFCSLFAMGCGPALGQKPFAAKLSRSKKGLFGKSQILSILTHMRDLDTLLPGENVQNFAAVLSYVHKISGFHEKSSEIKIGARAQWALGPRPNGPLGPGPIC